MMAARDRAGSAGARSAILREAAERSAAAEGGAGDVASATAAVQAPPRPDEAVRALPAVGTSEPPASAPPPQPAVAASAPSAPSAPPAPPAAPSRTAADDTLDRLREAKRRTRG
jgi:hypothetical protein